MKRGLVFITAVFITFCLHAQEKQIVVPYTLADRERAIRMEANLEMLTGRMSSMETRTSSMETRMSSMEIRMNHIENQVKFLDTKIDALDNRLNNRMDRLEDKFDSYFMWGFGLVRMSIFGLFGFIIYDRRTILAPLESKTDKIIKVLRDSAERDPELKESLRRTSLL